MTEVAPEIDWLEVRIPITRGHNPSTEEMTALVTEAVDRVLVNR